MSDTRQELRDKARQTGCEGVPPQAVVPTIPVRATVPCDPVAPELLPNTFVTPGGLVPVEDIPPTLDLISIGNDTQTRTCSDLPDKAGATGLAQTIPANSIVLNFSWYEVTPALTNGQIVYIASLYTELNTLTNFLVNSSSNAVAQLAAYTHLSDQQAASANSLALALKNSVNSQAVELALLQLVCGWFNQEQVVNCPTGALTSTEGTTLNVDAVNPSVITSGSVFSIDSIGDANTIAYNLAFTNLKCLYGNNTQTQTCANLFPLEPAVDSSPSESSITKAANTYFSSISKADANSLALEAATQELNCFWNNDAQTVLCSNDADTIPAVVNGTLIYNPSTGGLSEEFIDGEFPQGNVATGEVGNSVLVTADLFQSTVSFSDAQSQAQEAASALLSCRWGNTPIKAQCPVVQIDDPNRRGEIDPATGNLYKVKVVPNLELSSPEFIPNDFFLGLSTTNLTVNFDPKTLNVTPIAPSVTLQFAVGDLISLKPINLSNAVISGINLIGEITIISGNSYTVNVLQKIGDPVEVLGSSSWSRWQVTLSQGAVAVANSVLSDVSRSDANILAQGLVESLLRCIYCNVQIDPRCLPLQLNKNFNGELVTYDPNDIPVDTSAIVWDLASWIVIGGIRQPTALNLVWKTTPAGVPLVDAYGFKIPLYTGNTVIDPGLIKDPQFSWSDDATLGVAAGKFCGESVPVVTEIADNQLPISFYKELEDACIYCNDPVGADCVNGALIRKEDPLDGSIFLPARTVCVASTPNNYERKKYLIADSVTIAGTSSSSGLFSQTPSLAFTFSNTIDLTALGVAIGDVLHVAGNTIIKFPIIGVNNVTKTLTLSNPDSNVIPTALTQVFVTKTLKATFNEVSGVITATITTPGFLMGNYSFTLNEDYIKISLNEDIFILNGKTAPNIFNVLNPAGNPIPIGEQVVELWKKDNTNQVLAKQYATDAALDLAASLLQCISFNFACSSPVTRTCANIGKGTPADKLDPAGPITVTLPKCLISSTEASASELTAQASALADKLLNCQFFNDNLILPCSTGVVTGGRWLVNIGGNVPARTFLENSYTSAQQKAITLVNYIANSGACIWTNNTIKLTCNDVGAACPEANRCAPTTVEIPTGTFIHVVSSLNYSESYAGVLPNLDQQAIDYAKSLLLPICNICGNAAIPKDQLVCGGGGTLINFNKNVGANTFCASSQGAANAAANLLASGNAQCLPEFATKDYVDFEITRKICIGINYVEDPVNLKLANIESMRTRIELNLASLKSSIEELNTKVNDMYVECVDGEPTLQGNTGSISFEDLSVTPSIEALNITCPP